MWVAPLWNLECLIHQFEESRRPNSSSIRKYRETARTLPQLIHLCITEVFGDPNSVWFSSHFYQLLKHILPSLITVCPFRKFHLIALGRKWYLFLTSRTLKNLPHELSQDLIYFPGNKAQYFLPFPKLLHIWIQLLHLLDQATLGSQECSTSSQWLEIMTELPLCQLISAQSFLERLKERQFHVRVYLCRSKWTSC